MPVTTTPRHPPLRREEADEESRRVTADGEPRSDALALETAELLENPTAALAPVLASEQALTGTNVSPNFRPVDLKLEEIHAGNRWQLALTPTRWVGVPILGFAAAWNAFLVLWYSIAIKSGPLFGTIMGLFASLHVAAGLYITYFGLSRLMNRTLLHFDGGQFSVKQAPLPGKKVEMPVDRILRFEPVQRVTQGKDGTTREWKIKLLTRDSTQQDLPLELNNEEHAAHVAHRLNAIVDESRAPVGYRE